MSKVINACDDVIDNGEKRSCVSCNQNANSDLSFRTYMESILRLKKAKKVVLPK